MPSQSTHATIDKMNRTINFHQYEIPNKSTATTQSSTRSNGY